VDGINLTYESVVHSNYNSQNLSLRFSYIRANRNNTGSRNNACIRIDAGTRNTIPSINSGVSGNNNWNGERCNNRWDQKKVFN